jgi:hypothetical protein
MPIAHNPANTRLATDLKIFRRKILKPSPKDPNSAKEIRKHLNKKAPGKYAAASPGPKEDDIVTGQAFRDLSSWQSGKSPTNQEWVEFPNRLGGGLDGQMPLHLDPNTTGGLPNPIHPKIEWTPPGHPKIIVEILDGGVIKHTDKNGVEIHDAHHYMHGIFSNILYNLRDRLETINVALESYANVVSETDPATTQATAYTAAVDAFEKYCADLQPGGSSPYAGCFNYVGINPVVTNEGFIVSCRVKMNWKNPYHSSSTIRIP